jgi:hypothetical protein
MKMKHKERGQNSGWWVIYYSIQASAYSTAAFQYTGKRMTRRYSDETERERD